MAKKQIPNIDAGDLIAKHNGSKAASLVRRLVSEEEQTDAAPSAGTDGGASTKRERSESKRSVGRPKTTQRKRTTFFIDEELLEALRREKYENNKGATQVVNEALRRYFGL
jgi:uncharacterized protein (DUF4415 family)